MSMTLALNALPERAGDSDRAPHPLGAAAWSQQWLVLGDIPGACPSWPPWQARFPLQPAPPPLAHRAASPLLLPSTRKPPDLRAPFQQPWSCPVPLQALIGISGEESPRLGARPDGRWGTPSPGCGNKGWWPGCWPTRLGKGPRDFWAVPGGTGVQRRGAAA